MLSQNVKITTALDYASGTADREGAALDMSGWDGVLMIVKTAAIEAGGTNSIKAQQGSTSTPATDVLGTSQTIADDDDNEIFYIDLYQPRERYVRLVVDKDGANVCAESAVYIQYKGRTAPTTHAAGVTVEGHVAPAEGTA